MTRCSGIACIADDCKRHSFEGELYCGEHGGPAEYLSDDLTDDLTERAAMLAAARLAIADLAERSVTVLAAYAFGDWPPTSPAPGPLTPLRFHADGHACRDGLVLVAGELVPCREGIHRRRRRSGDR